MIIDISKQDSTYAHIVNRFRGVIEFNSQVSLFALVAIAAKVNPVAFVELYEAPKGQHAPMLDQIIDNALSQMAGVRSVRNLLNTAPEELLQELIYYVKSQPNFEKLAHMIADVYLGQRSKSARECGTSDSVAKLLSALVGDACGLRIYDGAAGICNTTSMIKPKSLQLEDIEEEACFLGSSILLLKGIEYDYVCNDSLVYLQPSACADLAVSQPPFGLRLSTENLSRIEGSKLLQFGQTERLPRSASDALWIQQALYHTHETGKALILLSQGWTFRGGYDAKLREFLIDNDLIQTIIVLPAGLLSFTHIPSTILILNKSKPENQKNRICFIDVSQRSEAEASNKALQADEIEKIVRLANDAVQKTPISATVKLPDIYQNGCNLSIGLYVQQAIVEEFEDFEEETSKLQEALLSFNSSKLRFEKAMNLDSTITKKAK
jgi:type I restriction enzyme M protein